MGDMDTDRIITLAELPAFAAELVEELPIDVGQEAYVMGLSGELGAGKTSLVQQIARALGVSGSVQSPTYVFAKAYSIDRAPFTRLVHMDLYRLGAEKARRDDEMASERTLGLRQYFDDPRTLVVAEWPEYLRSFPSHARMLTLTVLGEEVRQIRTH